MAAQLDEALAALRALVDAGRETFNDYCEEVWGPREDLRKAVAAGARVLNEALCPACDGLGYTVAGEDRTYACEACEGKGGIIPEWGNGFARPADANPPGEEKGK